MMALLLGSMLIAGMVLAEAIIRGSVLVQLWAWFIVPLGVVPITVSHAVGLATIIGFITVHLQNKKTEGSSVLGAILLNWVAQPLAVLLVGYIAHWFMV